jgi:hypothetical protein
MRARTRSTGAMTSCSRLRRAMANNHDTPAQSSRVMIRPATWRSCSADASDTVSSMPSSVLVHVRKVSPRSVRRPLSTTRSPAPWRWRMACCVGELRARARTRASRRASSLEDPAIVAAMVAAWMRATAFVSAFVARRCSTPSVAASARATTVVGSNPLRTSCLRRDAGLPGDRDETVMVALGRGLSMTNL